MDGKKSNGRPADVFAPLDTFERRHNGSGNPEDAQAMLKTLGLPSLDALAAKTIPATILVGRDLNLVR